MWSDYRTEERMEGEEQAKLQAVLAVGRVGQAMLSCHSDVCAGVRCYRLQIFLWWGVRGGS